MKNLTLHELRLNRRVLLALTVALGLFAFGMALIAPSIQNSLAEALKIIPPFLRALAGDRMNVQGLSGVVAIAFTHPVWLILQGAWAVGYGSRAIAGDIEGGTLGLTLAYPISRNRFLAAKTLTLATGTLALALVTVLATAAGLSFQQETLDAGLAGYFWSAVGMILLFGCIGAFALACSALAGSRGATGGETGRALGWTLSFTVGSYFIDALGQLWKTAEPYRPFSIFKHYDPRVLLEGIPPAPIAWAYLGGVGVLSLLVAWVAFNRRDLSI